MEATRWQKLDGIFDAALAIKSGERARFLSAECGGDEELRREIENLLEAHERAGDFIETPAMKIAAQTAANETRAGRRVGPYKILSPLGAGGMGVVYLAEDTRLGRKVALKLLPPAFAADQERIRRFAQEARAASALNHPNIVTIYDIGETSDTPFIATEYIEGQTLRQRLRAGRLPLKEALPVVEQVAAALSAAHRAGIVHRDIKPENIMLRPDGYVKVLDFGLAKLLEKTAAISGNTVSQPKETREGLLLGTASYMSPEQALGEKVDERSDIWSLGVVLYEMLVGQKPFRGPTQAAVFNAIINLPPPAPQETVESIPFGCNDLLFRAMEKERELRYQTAADLRSAAQRLQRELTATPLSSRQFAASAPPSRRRFTLGFAAVAALALAVAAFVFFPPRSSRQPLPAGPDWPKASVRQLTQAGGEYDVSLAPDGKSFLYASRAAGNWDIYWQRAGGRKPQNLTADSRADDTRPVYSPDGRYIAFRSERNPAGIYVMEATSENPRRVSDVGFNAAWSPDGKELVVSTDSFRTPVTRKTIPSQLWVINLASGAKRLLSQGDAVEPSWSPNGSRVAYWALRHGGQRDIWTLPAQGGEPVAVTDDPALDCNPVWSPDGKFLYFASNRGGSMNFWRVAIDENTGRVLSAPEAVTTPSAYSQNLSFSADGKRLAYVQRNESVNLEKITLDADKFKPSGPPAPVTQGAQHISDPALSPDGQWFAFSTQGDNQEDIALMKNDGTEARQLTNDIHHDRSPQWSPDGNRLAFYSDRSGRFEIWLINADGTGLRQLTHTSGQSAVYPFWSPDGSRIVYKQRDAQPYVIEVDKPWHEQTPQKLPSREGQGDNFWSFAWSPDGHKLAGVWFLGPDKQSFLHAYDFNTKRFENYGVTGSRPTWLSDNRRLLYTKENSLWMFDTHTRQNTEILNTGLHAIGAVCPTTDNRAIYYSLQKTESGVWLLTHE